VLKCKRHETSYLYRESLIRITYLETVFVELLLTECLKIWFCIIYAQFPTFPVATIECSPTLFNSGRCSVQRYIGETAALWLSSFHGKLIQQNIDFLYFSKTSKTTFNIIDRYGRGQIAQVQSENLSLGSTSGHYTKTQSNATGSFQQVPNPEVLNPEVALSNTQ